MIKTFTDGSSTFQAIQIEGSAGQINADIHLLIKGKKSPVISIHLNKDGLYLQLEGYRNNFALAIGDFLAVMGGVVRAFSKDEFTKRYKEIVEIEEMKELFNNMPRFINPPPTPPDPLTKQVGGDHYKGCAIQPVEFITANNLGFMEGSAIKYICRHEKKNGRQDIEKAIHYLELILKLKYKEVQP